MKKNSVEKYGLNILADYRSVEFGASVATFVGEGEMMGEVVTLAGNGTLTLSGKVAVRVEGFGECTLVTEGQTWATVQTVVAPNAELLLTHREHISAITRIENTVYLAAGSMYRERTALRATAQIDSLTTVVHTAKSSSDVIKNVAVENENIAIVRGAIVIEAAAAGSRGVEKLNALLLGERAEADLLPTVGYVDPLQLFYLESRGLAEQAAKDLLVTAFLAR